MQQDRVLIIDDDKLVQDVLRKSLDTKYEVHSAFSGEEGITAVNDCEPSVILLDVEMPGQNGYEVCDQLKRNGSTQDIPIIFLSSKSSLRERLLGYEVGGDDYLVKPCDKEELHVKLERLTHYSHERQSLEKTAQAAQATAMEALATSFELGKALRFVEASYSAPSFDVLASQLLDFCRDLQLTTVLLVVTRQGRKYYSTSAQVVPPLEAEVLDLLHSGKRIEDFGCRTQINYLQVSVLVKNMPLDDRARYGRIKDALPFVLGAADAKVRVLDAENALTAQTAQLSAAVETVNLSLADMREGYGNNGSALSSVMSELEATLAFDLRKMGFDQEQEDWLHDKIESASNSIHSCMRESDTQETLLSQVVDMLEKLTGEQHRIIQETLNNQPLEEYDTSDDVELF